MPNFDEAIREAEKLYSQKQPKQTEHTTTSKAETQETVDRQIEEKKTNDREHKPIIWKAILCVIPCLAIFFLTRILLALLIGLIGLIILKIPILNILLNLLNIARDGDLPLIIDLFVYIIPIFGAYCITALLQDKMMKYAPTITLSRRILGAIMALIHLNWLIVNISAGGNYPINIFCIIAALGFVFSNKDED